MTCHSHTDEDQQGSPQTTRARTRRRTTRPRTVAATRPDRDPDGTEPDDGPPRLYTPAEAAHFLKVPESWLRRQAGQRRIPGTYLGRHLRFSVANLRDIADAGTRTPRRRAR